MHHNYRAPTLEPMLHNKTSHCNEKPGLTLPRPHGLPPLHECSLVGWRKPTRLLLCTLGCSVVVLTSMGMGWGVPFSLLCFPPGAGVCSTLTTRQ